MSLIGKNIKKYIGEAKTPVLKGVDVEIKTGEFTAIVGRSGSGKSSLLYALSSLDRPSEGEVIIDNKSVYNLIDSELDYLRNKSIGFIFQFHFLLPELTALENVLMPSQAVAADPQIDQKNKAKELLGLVGLGQKLDRLPRQMSGGEQQRVAVARALLNSPRYLFADEPTGALDSENGNKVMQLFQKINSEFGTTIILVTHDLSFAEQASRIIKMKDGQIEEHK